MRGCLHAALAILASLRWVALRATAKTGPPGLRWVHAALAILASLRWVALRATAKTGPPGLRWVHAALAILASLLPACRGDVPPARPAAPAVLSQVEAVRAGRTATITATAPLTPEEWEALRGLPGLRVLDLRAGRADDERARTILASLPDVERLVLRESPLTDEGFVALAGLATLRDLNVPQAACTAAGVRALAALPHLRAVRLGGPRLRDGDICAALTALPGLRSLHLIDVPIGDRGLDLLAGMDGLWNLYLDGAGVSDGAWSRYFEARPHVHVHVDQAHHDRDPGRHDH